MSLTVDISLTQVALITAETASLLRRLFGADPSTLNLARQIERFLSVRADASEARARATELLAAWQSFIETPKYRELSLAHNKQRDMPKQDQVARRMRQMKRALEHEPSVESHARNPSSLV